MKVLVACEYSGTVRDAFIKRGHDAISCDLLPTDVPGPHYQGDVFDIIDQGFDLMIAHPPCTYLTCTGNKWFKPEFAERFPDRPKQREEAVEFFMRLVNANIPRIAVENPVGIISTRYRRSDQIINPWQFGHEVCKKTCLWLKGLPKLEPTKIVGKGVIGKSGTHSWHSKGASLPPLERMKFRSKTFQGIADAMAEQWGAIDECLKGK